MSETTTENKRGAGGCTTHKEGCRCFPCAARRRKAQALPEPNGTGRLASDVRAGKDSKGRVINADAPLVAQGKSPRDRVAQWLFIRHNEPGIKTAEVARRLGLAPASLYSLLSKANKEGWLRFDDPLARIEYEIIPKTLDNISEFLDQKDKQVTIEAFKSTIAAQYKESKGISDAPQTVLALKMEISNPTALAAAPKSITGKIVGTPKVLPTIDIEVVDDDAVQE